MYFETRKLVAGLVWLCCITGALHACEDDSEAPSVTPSEKQLVAVQATSEGSEGNQLVFSASGGTPKTPCDDTTPCPPWKKVDDSEGGGSGYVWTVTGDLIVDGATNESTLKIKRDAPAKGTVKVMKWQEWEDDSSPALGVGTDSGHSEAVEVEIIQVEIEGNATAEASDDLVRVKSTMPEKRFETPFRARVSAPTPLSEDVSITLMNPDGNIRFGASDTSKDITLPKNGDWVTFQVSGETGSSAKDDTLIEARIGGSEGEIAGQDYSTVFYFDPNDITIGKGSSYQWRDSGSRYVYDIPGGTAVNFVCTARLKPDDLDLQADALKNLWVGMSQVAKQSTRTRVHRFNNPIFVPLPGVTTYKVVAKRQWEEVYSRPQDAEDSEATDTPLYSRAGTSIAKPRINAQSDEKAETNDTPTDVVPYTIEVEAKDDNTGAVVGFLYYFAEGTKIDNNFKSWCVILDMSDDTITALRQSSWSLQLDSSLTGQKATVPDGDSDVSEMPISGAPFANTLVQNSANWTNGPVGTATKLFQK